MWRAVTRRLLSSTSGGSSQMPPEENNILRALRILKNDVTRMPGTVESSIKVPYESDVVIIGGGIIGSAIAYWLKQRNPEGFTCTVVEQDSKYTRAATCLSVGGIRQQFSCPENIQMSLFGAEFLRNIRMHLSVLDSDPPDVQFHHQGYLFLATDEDAENLQNNYKLQVEYGAKVELLTANQLRQKFPWLNTDGIALGCYGLENEGWFDPWSLLAAFKHKAMSLGVKYIEGEVVGFKFEKQEEVYLEDSNEEFEKLRAALIKMDDGKVYPLHFAFCFNAAGPWAAEIAHMAGIGKPQPNPILSVGIPVEPRKRYVYMVHSPNGPGLDCPFVVDPGKSFTYFRREGLLGNYLCGASPKENKEPSTDNLDVDYDFFHDEIWPVLARRVQSFEKLKVKAAWAGYYDYNTFDQNAIIGPHPIHENFFFANGFSGHGIQQAPAIGRAVMERFLDGQYKTIDLECFSFERIIDDNPICENCIV